MTETVLIPADWRDCLRWVASRGGVTAAPMGWKRTFAKCVRFGYLRREHGVYYVTASAAKELHAWEAQLVEWNLLSELRAV